MDCIEPSTIQLAKVEGVPPPGHSRLQKRFANLARGEWVVERFFSDFAEYIFCVKFKLAIIYQYCTKSSNFCQYCIKSSNVCQNCTKSSNVWQCWRKFCNTGGVSFMRSTKGGGSCDSILCCSASRSNSITGSQFPHFIGNVWKHLPAEQLRSLLDSCPLPLNSQLSFPRFVRHVWQHFLPEKLSDQFCSTLVILVALQATQHSDSTQRMSVFLEMFGPWKHLPRVAVFTRSLGGARNPCCMHTMWFFHFRWCPQLQDGSLDRGQTSLSLLFSQNQVIIVATSKITSISLSSQV